MDASVLDKRFLYINKNLGLLTGVWPYQKRERKILIRTMVFAIMMSCYFTQISSVIVERSVSFFLTAYPYLIVSFGTVLKLGNYIINESKLKILVGGIYEDWGSLTSEDEFKIITRYSQRGVFVVILYLIHMVLGAGVFFFLPFAPTILDKIKPLNQSRKRLYLYPAHYFVDLDEYHYPIVTHMIMILIVISFVFCACDTNYLYAVQHACGLLAISGHRFKYACHDCATGNKRNVIELMDTMYKNVCHSIRGHERALQYIKEIQSAHDACLFITMGILMISISVTLLQITEGEHDSQWMANCAFFIVQLLHMLFLTAQGQFVLNSYANIYENIFQGKWYNSGCNTQALHILALRRCLQPPSLTAGGIVPLHLKTFAEVVKASVSYYTVMQST